MKYRHSFHAGNFADVHKHVTLLALLRALKRKDKGFLYLDTHAGRGSYDLSGGSAEAAAGVGRILLADPASAELRDYIELIRSFRTGQARHAYPGSPLIAARELRAQDRAVLIELQGAEAHALEQSLAAHHGNELNVRVERGDGFARLRAFLPPPERRGLTLLDAPYEEQDDFGRVTAALVEAARRFPTGVVVLWYPIKDERTIAPWHAACARTLQGAMAVQPVVLVSELWLYPRDSRVGLNGSGLLVMNPPWLARERMEVWLPELQTCLAAGPAAGSSVRTLSDSSR